MKIFIRTWSDGYHPMFEGAFSTEATAKGETTQPPYYISDVELDDGEEGPFHQNVTTKLEQLSQMDLPEEAERLVKEIREWFVRGNV